MRCYLFLKSKERPSCRKRKRLDDSFGSDRSDNSADLFRPKISDSDDETDASASPDLFPARSPISPNKSDAATSHEASDSILGFSPSTPDETVAAPDSEDRASLNFSSPTLPENEARASSGFCCSTQLDETESLPTPHFSTASVSPEQPDVINATLSPNEFLFIDSD